jgi:hypothetical protein
MASRKSGHCIKISESDQEQMDEPQTSALALFDRCSLITRFTISLVTESVYFSLL